jgi:hypothetical protein
MLCHARFQWISVHLKYDQRMLYVSEEETKTKLKYLPPETIPPE